MMARQWLGELADAHWQNTLAWLDDPLAHRTREAVVREFRALLADRDRWRSDWEQTHAALVAAGSEQARLAPLVAQARAQAAFGPINPADPLGPAYTQAQLDAHVAQARAGGVAEERARIVASLRLYKQIPFAQTYAAAIEKSAKLRAMDPS